MRDRLKSLMKRALARAGMRLVRTPSPEQRLVRLLHRRGIEEVLDIGANTGQFAEELRTIGFRGRIVSVEPIPPAFERLRSRARADGRWSAVQAAVGSSAGRVTLNISANSVSSSVLPMLSTHTAAAPGSAYTHSLDVNCTTIDDIVEQHGLDPRRMLLKLDVQGYEKPALEGARRTLEAIAAIHIELSLVPLYEDQVLFQEMVAMLGDFGLRLWGLSPVFFDDSCERLLQVDGLLVRD